MLAAVNLLGALACSPGPSQEPDRHVAPSPPSLSLEQAEDGFPLPRGGRARLELPLVAGSFLRLVIEQQGIDAKISLHQPQSSKPLEIDGVNEDLGQEELVAVLPPTGSFFVEVVASEDEPHPPARLRLVRFEQRPPTPTDLDLLRQDQALRLGRELRDGGNPDDPLPPLREAATLARKLGLPCREADSSQELEEIHADRGQFQLALAFAQQARELYRGCPEPLLQAVAARSVGWARLKLGELPQAIVELEAALELCHQAARPSCSALAESYLGSANQQLGRLQTAIEHFDRAAAASKSLPNPTIRATLGIDRAVLLLALNRPDEALEAAQEAGKAAQAAGQGGYLLKALRAEARAQLQLDRAPEAVATLERARALLGSAPRADALLPLLITTGVAQRSGGNFEAAEQSLRQALELAQGDGGRDRRATALLELGYLELLTHRPQLALTTQEQALRTFRELGDAGGVASARVRKAQALLALDHAREAWKELEPALRTIEGMRTSTERRDLRSRYFAFRQDYYGIALDALGRLAALQPGQRWERLGLAVHDRRLARELLDARADHEARAPAEVDRQQEDDLEARLRQAASDPQAAPGELKALLDQFDRLRKAPRPATVAAPPFSSSLVDRVSRLLDADTRLLVIALGEAHSYRWWLARGSLREDELAPRAELEALAQEFTRTVFEHSQEADEKRERLGPRLQTALLGGLESELGGHRLLILADGALSRLPWAALPEPEQGPGHFLLERHELARLPSLGWLASERAPQPWPAGRPRLALFGDPVFAADDPRLGGPGPVPPASGQVPEVAAELERSVRALGLDELRRLPFTGDEVEEIRSRFPAATALTARGFDANRETFFATDWRNVDVLHLATHALAHPELPALSGVVLSCRDRRGQPEDGFVRAFEISERSLPLELVVLSACGTGVGRDLAGEGALSLARAFLEAGSRRVVSTLWPVQDRSTSKLMVLFYQAYLAGASSPAEALRQAQLALAAQPKTRSPYYWAGFQLEGDWRNTAGNASTRH